MTPERLNVLNELASRVTRIEHRLETHRRDIKSYKDWLNVTPSVMELVDKLIEQDLEEQLAVAKKEFEEAN